MTRLNTIDIARISCDLQKNDMYWHGIFGHTLEEIARKAVDAPCLNTGLRTATVPFTCGLGIIEGFNEAVKDILEHCGADVFITKKTDVAGIQEAYINGAELIFMADDDVCAAFSVNGKVSSDNGYATGIGFAAALEIMMERVEQEEVLILGSGPVGAAAAQYFSKKGAVPVLCDIDDEKACWVAASIKNARVERNRNHLRNYRYLLDATTSEDFIRSCDVTEQTRISAPGIPLGVSKEVMDQIPVFHNPLELGIMTMYFDCMKQMQEANAGRGQR